MYPSLVMASSSDPDRSLGLLSQTLQERSVTNHPPRSHHRFDTLPISVMHFLHALWCFPAQLSYRSGLRHWLAGSPPRQAESCSLPLQTIPSSPVAPHLASRQRSNRQLQAGERLPERIRTSMPETVHQRTSRGHQPTVRSIIRSKPRSGETGGPCEIAHSVAANAAWGVFYRLSGGSLCSPPAIHITPLRGFLPTVYSRKCRHLPSCV